MEERIETALKDVYETVFRKYLDIINVFVDQFNEENVDSDIMTFEQFVERISENTLGSLGIDSFESSNEYGSFVIDKEDYMENGRGKKLLEYIPDTGILYYLIPVFKQLITGMTILVHFPSVKITNEFGIHTTITDLYVRVYVSATGAILCPFEMTRTTFSLLHFKAGYAHSHLNTVSARSAGTFSRPCLGEGPIKNTQNSLMNRYNLHIWGLFALELEKYVSVESLSGGPYIRIDSIGKGRPCHSYDSLAYSMTNRSHFNEPELLHKFMVDFVKNHDIKLKYVNGVYDFGKSHVEMCIELSEAFINWHCDNFIKGTIKRSIRNLVHNGVLYKFIVSNGMLYTPNNINNITNAIQANGRRLAFDFKGSPVYLKITDIDSNQNEDIKTSFILEDRLCAYILTKLLYIINYEYSKPNTEGQSGTDKKYKLL